MAKKKKQKCRKKAVKSALVLGSNVSNFSVEGCEVDQSLLNAVLERQPCNVTHKEFIQSKRLVSFLQRQLQAEDDMNESTTYDLTTESDLLEDPASALLRAKGAKAAVRPRVTLQKDPFRTTHFNDKASARRCINLTLSVLKYSDVMTDLLLMTNFFDCCPELRDELNLVRVILFDLLERKLEHRTPIDNQTVDEQCLAVEQALKENEVRLAADFARLRIWRRALYLQDLLSTEQRDRDEIVSQLPLYAWVNQLLISCEDAVKQLVDSGLLYNVKRSTQMPNMNSFHGDVHCVDVFLFNRKVVDQLDKLSLFIENKMIFADKATCIACAAMTYNAEENHSFTLVNPLSVWFGLHLESLLAAKFDNNEGEGTKSQNLIRIIFTKPGVRRAEKEMKKLVGTGSKNIVFLEDYQNVGKWPNTDFAIVYGITTLAGVIDPTNFLMSSDRAESSIVYSSIIDFDVSTLRSSEFNWIGLNIDAMKNALQMMTLKQIMFVTHSLDVSETIQTVQKVIEAVNSDDKGGTLEWTMVCPVMRSFRTTDFIGRVLGNEGLYLSPSVECNGAYIATCERQLKTMSEPVGMPIVRQKSLQIPSNVQESAKRPVRKQRNVNNVHVLAKRWYLQNRRKIARARSKRTPTSNQRKPTGADEDLKHKPSPFAMHASRGDIEIFDF